MVRTPRRRALIAALVGAALLGIGAAAVPAFAEDTGSITGHLSDGGVPVTNASVILYDTTQNSVGFTNVDALGSFTFSGLPAGGYKLQFTIGNYSQWYPQEEFSEDADVIAVVDGQVTTVEEAIRPYGVIAGQVTRADGTPAAFLSVIATGEGAGSATTDSAGNYTIRYLRPGDHYRVQFASFASPTQYAHGATSADAATLFSVAAGETTRVDEQLLPTGTITGTLTRADGTPVPFAFVSVNSQRSTSTNFEGRYTLTAFPGTYSVSFRTPYGSQWAIGKSSAVLADPISVDANGTTTLDEVLVPFGSVTVTAVDSVTGAPVSAFCINAEFGFGCTDTASLTDTEALPGRYRVFIFPQDERYISADAFVEVTSGGSTSVVVSLTPAATLTTTIVDKVTGAPVADACLELVPVTEPNRLGMGGVCTDAGGVVAISRITAGSYKAFVFAHDGVHGHQWVSVNGGEGRFSKAKTITIAPGQAVTLPTVRLDAGGTITGTVTDEVTGAPLTTRGSVSLSSFIAGFGGQQGIVGIDGQGRYTLPNLGPYHWELFFISPGYASEWSGDSATRNNAKSVNVKKGQITTYDTALGLGTTVTVTAVDPAGDAVDSGRLTFFSVASADEIGHADVNAGGGDFVTQLKGPQEVRVQYGVQVGGQVYSGWAGGTSFADASSFFIPVSGTISLDITVTHTGP